MFIFTVLKRSYRHRFPRFFAFESIIGLVLLNVEYWFLNPLSARQLLAWTFLAASLVLVLHGFQLLRTIGQPKDDLEETTQLITKGASPYIRHPIYCSFLLGCVGVFLKRPSFIGLILFLILSGFVFLTGKVEEEENIQRFGEEYGVYMKKWKDTEKLRLL